MTVAPSLISAYLNVAEPLRRSVHRIKRLGRGCPVTFFHDVGSPHSDLLARVLAQVAPRLPAQLEVELVGPPAEAFVPDRARAARYGLVDADRLARRHGVSAAYSVCPSAERVVEAQRALAAPLPVTEFFAKAAEVGDQLFSGKGALPTGVDAQARLASGERRLRALGHFQGGALHHQGVWYPGLDRLPHLVERLEAGGGSMTLPPPRRIDLPSVPDGAPFEVFFSFRSPYSYLGFGRAMKLAERHRLQVKLRPVLPMVVRGLSLPRVKRWYLVHDAKREADRLGVPFGKIFDPLGEGVERCLAVVCHLPEEEQAGFTQSAMTAIWSEGRDLRLDRQLRTVVERGGASWSAALDGLAEDAWRVTVESHREMLSELGLWGVPSFRLGTVSTWGQDRLWVLESALAT